MSKTIGIYKITSPTEKIYIGQSWWIENRMYYYKNLHCSKQPILYASLKKYGWNDHIVEIIEKYDTITTQQILDEREIYWINYYKILGYTLLNIKDGGSTGKHSKESVERMRKKISGKNHYNYGKHRSEETKQKLKEANTGDKNPKFWLGKKRSADFRKKMSIGNTGKIRSEAFKKNLCKPVLQLDMNELLIKEWPSIKAVYDDLKIDHISAVCKNKQNHAGGFKWKYKL